LPVTSGVRKCPLTGLMPNSLHKRQGDIVRIRQQLGFTITNLREALQRFAGMGGNQISNGIKLKTKRPFNGARQGGGSGGACDE